MCEPYTAEELYKIASNAVKKCYQNERQDIIDDAIQSYVVGAYECIDNYNYKEKTGIRGFQRTVGWRRAVDFMRYEKRRKTQRYIQIDTIDKMQLTPLEILEAREELGLFSL